jgi:hypothetical protein
LSTAISGISQYLANAQVLAYFPIYYVKLNGILIIFDAVRTSTFREAANSVAFIEIWCQREFFGIELRVLLLATQEAGTHLPDRTWFHVNLSDQIYDCGSSMASAENSATQSTRSRLRPFLPYGHTIVFALVESGTSAAPIT